MQKDYGAFMPGDRLKILGRETGPLAGKTFAAKDVFDIAGYPTSNGQPTWPKTRPCPRPMPPRWSSFLTRALLLKANRLRRNVLQPRGRQRPLWRARKPRLRTVPSEAPRQVPHPLSQADWWILHWAPIAADR